MNKYIFGMGGQRLAHYVIVCLVVGLFLQLVRCKGHSDEQCVRPQGLGDEQLHLNVKTTESIVGDQIATAEDVSSAAQQP